uniref:Uncharacterized protein n=1 Tax=Oryza sativa subsp. japonica TaxID=39947 RepID=Q652G6_ORYSJ|nr:hypothetical protein [Oryza sativa Japonica Group]
MWTRAEGIRKWFGMCRGVGQWYEEAAKVVSRSVRLGLLADIAVTEVFAIVVRRLLRVTDRTLLLYIRGCRPEALANGGGRKRGT